MIIKCENCIHKKNCIDGANFEKALKCTRYSEEPMTAKEYLSQAYKINKEIELTLAKSYAMRKSLYCGRGQNFDIISHSKSSKSFAEAMQKVIDYEHDADNLTDKLVDKRIEIENTIKNVPDSKLQEVLTKRYLEFKPWDGRYNKVTQKYVKGIYEEMGYSQSQVFDFHKKALKFVDKILKIRSESE